MRRSLVLAVLSTLGLGLSAEGSAAETLYVHAGTVIPVDGEAIPDGRIIVRDGKVAELGADLERPPFSKLVDARELTITPGFVVPVSAIEEFLLGANHGVKIG